DCIADLASADGQVVMRERPVTAVEIGKPLSAIATGMGLRISRGNHIHGYWERAAQSLKAGDVIVEIARTKPHEDENIVL
ncbi:MAG TPA: hypothetical protein VLZ84_10720, partial [Asticcacaulis sp.]|nr:hypothetical protein [Asticcacaulis sp.]